MSDRFEREVLGVLTGARGARSPRRQIAGPVEGRIVAVTDAGATFTVADFDGGKHVFGPAPWPMSRIEPNTHSHPNVGGSTHDHVETVPVAGWRCLVLFVGAGIGNPWVVGVWPPAGA